MKKASLVGMAALLLAAVMGMGLGGCGSREGFGGESGTDTPQPNPVSIKTGTIATDSWGFTGAAPVQVAAPDKTALTLPAHTLLEDASHAVVSGVIPTSIGFSVTAPSVAARALAPAGKFLCYVDISLGPATAAIPVPSVTVDAGAVPGETLTMYSYDASAVKWSSPQTAVVDGQGKVTFPVSSFSIWAIFR